MNNIMLNMENKMINVFVDIITQYNKFKRVDETTLGAINKKIRSNLVDKYKNRSSIFFYDNCFKYHNNYILYSSIYRIETNNDSNIIYLFIKYYTDNSYISIKIDNDANLYNLILEKLIEKIFGE